MRLLVFLFYFVLAILPSCTKKKPQEAPIVEVTTYVVEPQTIPAVFEFVGVAESSHLVEIRSRVEGYLWKIAYTEGSFVQEGDLLFEIDPRQFEAATQEAKGELARQHAILWAAQQSVSRYKPLYEQKAASKKDLDDATAQMLAGEASVETAAGKLKEAELNLSYTSITTPISGLSGRSKYREGTLITPSINGLLTTVAIIDPIWVNFTVSDYYLLNNNEEIAKNQLKYPENNNFEVSLILADGSEFPYLGEVNFTSPTLDQNTGTMMVRSIFKNPQKELRPGQFVRARVTGATRPNAIIVPQQSVQQGAKGMYVYVVNQEGKAEMRYVATGDWYKNNWIIKEGLSPGDVVIVEGVNKVNNGTSVQTTKQASSTDSNPNLKAGEEIYTSPKSFFVKN